MAPDRSWRPVEPVPRLNGDVAALLATIDDLRRVWEETLTLATRDEVREARQRSMRRHAIETGVIERLYNVDWGVTEALVAEGLTLDVASHEGGVNDDTLAIIRDQYDALEYLADAARGGSPLTLQFIRELHLLITRHQPTYEAKDQFERLVHIPLPHGAWKTQQNHAVQSDGSVVEFTPPDQVQIEMQALLNEYERRQDVHPIIRATWLHHQFINIHPFADGNGRVGRALTLLVLLQAHYAPLVVDRRQRSEYISAIEDANAGDLRPLVRLFARLEGIALRSELIRPTEATPLGGGAVEVARAYADRLRALVHSPNVEQANQTNGLAASIHARLSVYFADVREQFLDAFQSVDPNAEVAVYQAAPGDDRSGWWRAQLIRTANAVDFYTNLREGSWWTHLKLTVLGQTMRFVVSVQKVGRGETGVLAVTAFAESVDPNAEIDGARPTQLINPGPADSVTLVYRDSTDARWPEIASMVDRSLAASIASFSNGLG